MNNINFSQVEFEKFLSNAKKLGYGNEGSVYAYSKDIALKFYHVSSKKIINDMYEYEIDEDGVKKIIPNTVNKIKTTTKIITPPYEIDLFGVKKVYTSNQISEAVKRQKNIFHSNLPLGCIYVDKKFVGVVLKRLKGYFNIHNIGFLPIKTKLKILEEILEKLKELTDSNIYPIDFGFPTKGDKPHSNILINTLGNTEFIDLEGKSTIYRNNKDKYFENYSYMEFFNLLLFLMFDIEMTFDDSESIEYELISKGIDKTLANSMIYNDEVDYNKSTELLNNLRLIHHK
jgi:hypothetical protein